MWIRKVLDALDGTGQVGKTMVMYWVGELHSRRHAVPIRQFKI
jgi:hypothetical protein